MNRRFFIKGLAAAITCGVYNRALAQAFPVVGTALPLKFQIGRPGRIGLYVDYSELNSIGEHVFLVCRTHGTQGAATVQYSSHGDAHDSVSGQLSWADGDADIKSIRVNVPSKTAGDHRIHLQLSSATGSALHFGSHTRAYGVIDDGTVATDTNAIFFDTSLSSNGTGTQSSPFDNIYDAISNVGSRRYIYGRGTVVPDGTNRGGPYSQTTNCIDVPASRPDEANRLYIRNWPGSSLTINGNGSSSTAGFLSNGSHSYHTYRGIDFVNLDTTSGQGLPGWGIWYHYGSWEGLTVELCNFNGINGSENNGGVNAYGGTGAKVWRCNFANIAKNGDTTDGNNAGVFSYEASAVSIQRCEFESSMASGGYHKRTLPGKVSFSFRFNVFRDCNAHYGALTTGHFGLICSNNLFIGANGRFTHKTNRDQFIYSDNQVSNNYFYLSGKNEEGAITAQRMGGALVFGNIFDNCRRAYFDFAAVSDPFYLDRNIIYQPDFQAYAIGRYYQTSAELNSAFPNYAGNDVTGAPRPTNINAEDVNLLTGSSAVSASVGGSDAGVYLTGLEQIGSNKIAIINPDPFPAPNPSPGPAPGPNPVMCTPPPSSTQKIILS